MKNQDIAAFKRRIIHEQHGFLTDRDTEVLAADEFSRLDSLLVRCGGCRFVCSAQDVTHIISALESSGDYVRDVAFLAGGLNG
jgi:hypothetical protein